MIQRLAQLNMRAFTQKVTEKIQWNKAVDALSPMAAPRWRKFYTMSWQHALARQTYTRGTAPGDFWGAPLSTRSLSALRYFSSDETENPAHFKSSEAHSESSSTSRTTGDIEGTQSPAAAFTIPGAQAGGRKLAIVFTCNVCDTRSAKQFTERSYLQGVVIVRCPGCQNLHLIADRLGYFGSEDFDLDSIVRESGYDMKIFTDENVYELSLEDLVGKEKMDDLLRQHDEKSHHGSS